MCALMGVAATFVSSTLVKQFGILKVSSLSFSVFFFFLILHMGKFEHLFFIKLLRFFSLYQAGAVGLVFQALLLSMAVAVYWSGTISHQSPLLTFLFLIVSH